MRLVIFEDSQSRQLYPLTEMHPAWDLLIGSERLGVRIQRTVGLTDCRYQCRHLLQAVMEEGGWSCYKGDADEGILFVNGRSVLLPLEELLQLEPGRILQDDRGNCVAFRLAAGDSLPEFTTTGYLNPPDYPVTEVTATLINEPWELMTQNEVALRSDFVRPEASREPAGVTQIEPAAINLHPAARFGAGVVLDASGGPITIGADCTIGSLTVIEGPVHIATGCRVKAHSHIYDSTSLGPHCRIGGEVENTICHSYVNKQHQGFVGHSILMPWTNLGADTNTSDLKNNYSNVRISRRGEVVDSGQQFIGLLLGDHSKCAINTRFNTGTVVGPFAQVFRSGFPPKEISPFSWGDRGTGSYRLEDALQVAERVMTRRRRQLTDSMKELIAELHRKALAAAATD